MSYWKKAEGKNYSSLDNFKTTPSAQSGGTSGEFYEFEPAIVLDIILDEKHEIFSSKTTPKLDSDRWQSDLTGKKPSKDDPDLTWIGRALIRPIVSQNSVEKEELIWAIPFEGGVSEYPLVNEIVIFVKYMDKAFYTRKLNFNNYVNTNADLQAEANYGGYSKGEEQLGNRELNQPNVAYQGPASKLRTDGGNGWEAALGRYFLTNKNIRGIKRFEGDTVLESRFGQSIRFSTYDDVRGNDSGLKGYKDYYGQVNNPKFNVKAGGGNPMIFIRNRQRPLLEEGKTHQVAPLPKITGTKVEKNVGGYLEEDINYDGSSIQITSGMTISKWVTSCYKKMWTVGTEEQKAYSPNGCSPFKFPVLDHDQIIISSDRLVLSARWGEQFQYSKKRFSIVTDSEYTVDAHDQMIFNTNVKTVINSPAIYLGEYDQTGEPALLGQTTVNWMYDLCNWLLEHSHWYLHSHEDAGKESPSQTQLPVQIQQLIALRDKLQTLLSRRVFITG